MAVNPRTEPGAPTLAKKWWMDVNIGTHEDPDWLEVGSINNFNMEMNPTTKDYSTYASKAWGSDATTKIKYALNFNAIRNTLPDDLTAYDPGQEYLRGFAPKVGVSGRVEVRWYEMEDDGPRAEAYQGYVTVQWKPVAGSEEDVSTVAVTCPGQGEPVAIAHPEGAAVPRVRSLTPASGPAAGGTLITIAGSGFSGVNGAGGVKIGGTNATTYSVVSSSRISAVVPAHATGAAQVVVTNATGPSTDAVNFTYTA